MIHIQEIDHLTERYYQCVSFNKEHYPNYDMLKEVFYGAGSIINNNFDVPTEFTLESFSQALSNQIEKGNSEFFVQQEISDTTEIFGKIAQRVSVYEYSSSDMLDNQWKKGINYIQYILIESQWKITSMVWQDEKEEAKIPADLLI